MEIELNVDKKENENTNLDSRVIDLHKKQEKKYLIAKMENIYLSFKEDPVAFKRVRLLMAFIICLNQIVIWILFSSLGKVKNNYYCYNPYRNSFEKCDIFDECINGNKGVLNFVTTSDLDFTIRDKETLEELNKINKFFKTFFIKESFVYSLTNFDSLTKVKNMIKYYNIVINVDYRENWNVYNMFNQHCSRQTTSIEFGLAVLAGSIIGNIFITFFADIYGRKRLLVILTTISMLSCLGIFFFGIHIENVRKTENIKTTIKLEDDKIKDFLNLYKKIEYIDNNYKVRLEPIFQGILKNKLVDRAFSNKKILLYICLMFLTSAIFAAFNICLSFSLETSINDSFIYSSYLYFYLGFGLSYLLHFILLTFAKSFHLPFMIVAALDLGILIVLLFFTKESPRYNFEFAQYDVLTETLMTLITDNKATNLLIRGSNQKFQNEIKKLQEDKKASIWNVVLSNRILFYGMKKKVAVYKREIRQKQFCDVKRSDLMQNPLLMWIFIQCNKAIRNRWLILLSLIANISLIFFVSIFNINMAYIVSRRDLYDNYIVNTTPFFMTISICLSTLFFYFLLKFFGVNVILFICFSFSFILSIVYSVYVFNEIAPRDLNRFYFMDVQFLMKYKNTMTAVLCVICFFTNGLFFSLYFFLTKYTQTLYRSLFYGLCSFVVNFMLFFAYTLVQYFETSMTYLMIASLIGLVNAYFIDGDMDYNIVTDFRKIEITEEVF